MAKAVIVGYSRSPFTIASKGQLVSVRPEDLLSEVIKDLVSKTKINPEDIEDIINDFEDGFRAAKKLKLAANK